VVVVGICLLVKFMIMIWFLNVIIFVDGLVCY